VHQVAEHGPGVDGRELVGIAHEHEPCGGPECLEQPGHHRQRHHRRLVHHHDVEGQPVGGVVPEAAAAVGPPAEQPVQRLGGEVQRQADGRRLLQHRLLQPGGRLAGRGGQRDARSGTGLVEQQPEQPGDRVRLSGAGPSGDDADPPAGGHRGGQPLQVRCGSVEEFRQRREVDRRRRPGRALVELAPHLLLLLPVPVEVQQAVDQSQRSPRRIRSDRDHGAVVQCSPVLRPAQLDRLPVLVGHHRAGDGGELDAHRSGADTADGERGRQQDRLPLLAAEPGQTQGDVHVGGGEDAGLGELPQQTVRADGDHGRPASRSDSAGTSPCGGVQENTPAPAGVAAPAIPRTNR
jgi:hypothetical protein